jgi:hypothetical protein
VAEDVNALAASINPESMQRPLVRHYKRREIVRRLLGASPWEVDRPKPALVCASPVFGRFSIVQGVKLTLLAG